MNALILDRRLVVLDCETTGINVERDRIVELAVLAVSCDGTVGCAFPTVSKRFNPGIPIPPEATAIHGISDADVERCPLFSEDAVFLATLVRGCDVLAYNGQFDMRILAAEFARAGVTPSPLKDARLIDPCRIFHRKHPRDLAAAAKLFCGVDHSNAHDAGADAVVTMRVLEAQLAQFDDLPRTVAELAAYCENRDPNWIDSAGKLVWRGDDACVSFGKYAGVPLRQLARTEQSFLQWMLAKDFPDDTKRIVASALRGTFPVKPQAQEAQHA